MQQDAFKALKILHLGIMAGLAFFQQAFSCFFKPAA